MTFLPSYNGQKKTDSPAPKLTPLVRKTDSPAPKLTPLVKSLVRILKKTAMF